MPIDGELTAPDDSLRSELEAQFAGGDDVSSPASGLDGTEVQPSVEGSDLQTDTSDKASNDGRVRDPATGQFAPKKDAPAVAADKAPATDPNSPSIDPTKASEVAAQPAAVAPPAGWTAAEKAEWTKLPPAVQAAVSRREAEIANGGKQWSDEKRRYEAVLSPVAEAARRNGHTTESGLKALLDAQSFLERDPANAIKWLAQSHGINLATLAGQPPAEGSSAQIQQPDITALVRQAVAPLVAPIQQRWQQEERRQQDMTTQMVVDFAASPGHEHFESVQQDIMDLIPPLKERNPNWSPQQVLQEAYERATFANPATRQTILTARETAAETQRRAEAAARATKARGAAVSITGSPSGTSASEAAGTLREEILRAMTG